MLKLNLNPSIIYLGVHDIISSLPMFSRAFSTYMFLMVGILKDKRFVQVPSVVEGSFSLMLLTGLIVDSDVNHNV